MAVVSEVILKLNFWSIFEDVCISFEESSLLSDFFIILTGSTYVPLISEKITDDVMNNKRKVDMIVLISK